MAPAPRRGFLVALQGALSFRVLIALSTSASVTAAVAGPMAYQASKARDEQAVSAPAPGVTTTTSRPPIVKIDPTTSTPNTSTTTSSTTTTTEPGVLTPTTTRGPGATTTVPGATTTPPGPTTTVAPLSATGLFFSASRDHSPPVPLAGGLGGYRVWLFVDAPKVRSVKFWVDDPTGAGAPDRVASSAPFDLDPAGIDLRATYGLGRHQLLAEITTTDGSTYRRLASFDVVA